MQNEILLIVSLIITYSVVLILFALFRRRGLYLWSVIATIAANIEVLIVVNAFGMEMTLGNILFASTFLGIATSVCFILLSQSWMLYIPNENDFAMPSIRTVFSNTPRLMAVGIAVYAIVQLFDVWAYHKWWAFTSRRFQDSHKFLWLRNNGSTLISQLLNTILFTWGAFLGTHDTQTLISIACASYLIFIVTSLADTPFVYLARTLQERIHKTDSDLDSID